MKTNRSTSRSLALVAAISATFLGFAATSADARHPAPSRCHVSAKPVVVRPYSAAVRIGPLVISSGHRGPVYHSGPPAYHCAPPVYRSAPVYRYHRPHVVTRSHARGPVRCRR